MHFLEKFTTLSGKEEEFRAELLRVVEQTRREAGCLGVRVFESLHDPCQFGIHSEWVDEAAFELHITMPHTARFIEAAGRLLSHEIHGLRSREIGISSLD